VLEETVLRGLKDNLLQPEVIHEFVTTYQREYNRLRREQTNEQAAAHAEEPPMLHPVLAEVYRRKVEKLTER
jgi:hypothetical protein